MQHSLPARAAARRGLWAIALAAVLWGTVGITTQTLYQRVGATPLSVGFWRLALAAPALALACQLRLGRAAWRVRRRDLALMGLIGATLALYQVCYFAAISRTGVAVATLVTLCTAPVIVAIVTVARGGARPMPATILTLAGALAGTALLIVGRPGAAAHAAAVGVLLALGSATGYAIVVLAGRALAGRAHPLQVTAISFSAGATLLLAPALATGFVARYPADGWLLLAYLGVVPTALAYGLFAAGIRTTPATTASVVTLLEPLTATVLAQVLFGEQLGLGGTLGAALLLGALLLLARDAPP